MIRELYTEPSRMEQKSTMIEVNPNGKEVPWTLANCHKDSDKIDVKELTYSYSLGHGTVVS